MQTPVDSGKKPGQRQPYLSTEEVARWLGFSTRAITLWAQQWVESGGHQGLPGFKIGKCWRFDPELIQEWVSKQRSNPDYHEGM